MVVQQSVKAYATMPKGSLRNTPINFNQSSESIIPRSCSEDLRLRAKWILSLIEIYWVFLKLPFGIVAYAFTLCWTTIVETAVYLLRALKQLYTINHWYGCSYPQSQISGHARVKHC